MPDRAKRSPIELLAGEGHAAVAAFLAGRGAQDLAQLEHYWPFWRRPEQTPPPGDWRVWLVLAGRGFGKTRMGAEWVREIATGSPRARIALVGSSAGDVRRVMVEGESGLLAIGPEHERPVWEASIGRLRWANGAQAHVYSAAEPDGLRGPQHSHGWADEIAKWPNAEATWDNLSMTMRIGARPQVVATTTPRPVPLLRRLVVDPAVRVTNGRTGDNRANLPPAFLAAMHENYAGTRLGRQELDGELIGDLPDALWSRDLIERCRVAAAPPLRRVVVGVDPPAGVQGDACGIVAVGMGDDGTGYVLEDASVEGLRPEGWARAVAACAARHRADRVVAEANQGGAMVESVLAAADLSLPVRLVHATQGKVARAEPVMLRYERGAVRHVGVLPELEDQMAGMTAGGGYHGPGRSPDRADALVWALTELLLRGRGGTAGIKVV